MTYELPRGWESVRLGEITSKVGSGATPRGGSESYEAQGVPFIRSMNVRFEGFATEGLAFLNKIQAKALDTVTVMSGDVLLNITGASIGRVTQAPASMNGARVSQHVCIIRPKPELEAAFLARFLASAPVQRMIWTEQYGVTRQALTKGQILDFDIPLPSLSEQRRIVAKLEKLLAQVHTCQERLAKIPALLKRFRQSVLAAACSGRLTADWREHNPDTEQWKSLELREVSERIQIGPFGTQLHKSDYVFNGVPLINPTHIQDSRIAHDPKFSVSKTKLKGLENYVLQENDIILGRRGEMGRCALVSRKESGWLCGTGSLFVRPKSDINPEYLFLVLRSPETKAVLEGESKGTTMSNLNLEILMKVPVFFSSLAEQQEVVRRVESLFALADRIEARLAEGRKRVDSITQAILGKAFRGELVPTEFELTKAEGRAFESAEEPLERIPQDGSQRGKQSKTSATNRDQRRGSTSLTR